MIADTSIADRLTAVENAIVDLRSRLGDRTPAPNWLQRVIGSFKDEPEFAKVVEFGREIRASDCPAQGNQT